MAYDNTSVNGDEISDYYYDIENNLMNPPSPVGYFLYKVVGGCFDWLDELINQFRIDMSVLDCNVSGIQIVKEFPAEPNTKLTYYIPIYTPEGNNYTKYEYENGSWNSTTVQTKVLNTLDTFWGRSYDLERPFISYVNDGVIYSRMFTDEEYKRYMYLRNHRLMTRQDLLVAFNNAFGVESGEEIEEVNIITMSLQDIHTVNHKQYDSPPFSNVTLAAIDPYDDEIIIDKFHTDYDVNVICDKKTAGTIITVIIPYSGWDEHYLEALEEFVSIKGNVKISQKGGG